MKQNRIAEAILADWKITTLDTWQSGVLLATPASNNRSAVTCPRATRGRCVSRVVPLYLKRSELRLHRSDPGDRSESGGLAGSGPGRSGQQYRLLQRLPRAAPAGDFGRHRQGVQDPGAVSLQRPRGVLQSVQSELSLANPSTGSPAERRRRVPTAVLTGGFGYLNYTGIAGNSVNSSLPTPRTGQLVARIQF